MSWARVQTLTRVFLAGSCFLLVMGDEKPIEYPPVLEGSTVTLSCKGNTTTADRGHISWQKVTNTENQKDVSTCNLRTRKCENYDGDNFQAEFLADGGLSGHFTLNLIISNVSVSQKDDVYVCTVYNNAENSALPMHNFIFTDIYARPQFPRCEAHSLDDLKIHIVCSTPRVHPSLSCQLELGQKGSFLTMHSINTTLNPDSSFSSSCHYTFLESSPGIHFFKIRMFPLARIIEGTNLVADVNTSVKIFSTPKVVMALSRPDKFSAPDILICSVYRLSSLPKINFVFNHTEYQAEVFNTSYIFVNSSYQKYIAILNISSHSPSADQTITCKVTAESTPGLMSLTQTIQELVISSRVENTCQDQQRIPKLNNFENEKTVVNDNTAGAILVAQICSIFLIFVVGFLVYYRRFVIDKVRQTVCLCDSPESSQEFEN